MFDAPATTDLWLLLHGTPLTPEIWSAVAAELPPHQMVQAPALIAGGDPATATVRLAASVLEAAPQTGGAIHVVGHSFGGQVALELALLAPQRVGSLTMICSRDTPFPAFADAAGPLPSRGAVDVDGALARWFGPSELGDGGPLVDYARRCLTTADRAEWATALDAIAGFDRSAHVSGLELPVRLIAAEHDAVSSPAAMSELAARLPHASLHVIEGAAHLSP